jgi:hypothetical protein
MNQVEHPASLQAGQEARHPHRFVPGGLLTERGSQLVRVSRLAQAWRQAAGLAREAAEGLVDRRQVPGDPVGQKQVLGDHPQIREQ